MGGLCFGEKLDGCYAFPMTKQCRGFSSLVAVIIIVGLVALLAGGYAVWQQKGPRESSLTLALEKVLSSKDHRLKFIDPNEYSRVSLNGAFPISWEYADPVSSGGIDLVLVKEDGECMIVENTDITLKRHYWVPRLVCPIVDGGRYTLAAYAHEGRALLAVSETFTGEDYQESIEAFAPGERFAFSGTGISFQLPQTTEQILRTQAPQPKLSVFFGTGELTITVDDYFGEWNAGVPVTLVSTSTVQLSGRPEMLSVYTSTVGHEAGTQSAPFVVVFLDRDLDGEDDSMIYAPYASDIEKETVDTFLRSILISR